jgi:hypothetical protein
LAKETARRGDTAPGQGDTRATDELGAVLTGNGLDTGQLSTDTDTHDGTPLRAVVTTAPLQNDTGAAQTLVLGGLPVSETEITAELARRARHRNRRLLILGMVLAFFLLVVVFLSMSPFTDPVAGSPPRTPYPIALAEVQPYGVNTFLHKEVDQWKKEKTLDLSRQMGAGWIKQQFPWAEIEFRENPNDPFWDVKNNQNAWGKFDGIVDLAEKYGLRVIARIDTVPAWAWPTDAELLKRLEEQGIHPAKSPPIGAHLDDFSAFIDTFVKRYRGRISAIQVWNEPNLKGEWATGQPVNSAEYVELLKAAYSAAKAADPNIIVLAAPLATNNERLSFDGNQNEVDYLQGMYDAGAAQWFDAMAANAYGTTYPPEDPPSRDRLNFRRVELLREVMEKNGDSAKAVWFNEYGWNASPADMPQEKLRWGRVSEEEQAAYTVRGIEYARANWPWAGAFTIWYMRQVGDIPRTESEYFFGLVNPEFVVSPAYRSVQAQAGGEKSATPGEWGPLSEPIAAGPRWQLRLDGDSSYVLPTAPGDALDIPFTGTALKVRLAPITQTGVTSDTLSTRYYVTVDGGSERVSSGLPRDEEGRAFIEVTGGEATEVTLASGLGEQFSTGRHVARIWVDMPRIDGPNSGQGSAGGGSRVYAPRRQSLNMPGIAAVIVEAHRSYILFAVFSLALLGVMAWIIWKLRKYRTV